VQKTLETCKISISVPEKPKIIISFVKQQILQYKNERKISRKYTILSTGSERVKIEKKI